MSRLSEAAKLQPDLVLHKFLLQKNLIEEWPLSADHLLDRVDTSDVLSGQVLAGAIDPADHKQSALPTDELLEIKFQPRECVVHDRSVIGMTSSDDVDVYDSGIY